MRTLIRCLALCLLATTAALPAGAGQPSTVASLKAQANQAAARYAVARATHARLGDQVAALERQVSDLEGRLGPLRDQVTREAVAVYQGDVAVDAVNQFEAAAAMLRSDRAAHMVSSMSARHMPAINSLLAARQRIRERQADLNARRHEQDVLMTDLRAQRDRITRELDALAAALPPRTARQPQPRSSRATAGVAQRLRGAAAPGASFVCPIDGPLAFSDDFGASRGGGRRHMGVDLLSPKGTVNVAVVNGTIETKPWAGGGITIFLRGDDGHTYVYMHLMQIEGPVPRRVAQGEVIALTGSTGHSYGYHTHFEYHPNGGNAVSPYPLLSAACL